MIRLSILYKYSLPTQIQCIAIMTTAMIWPIIDNHVFMNSGWVLLAVEPQMRFGGQQPYTDPNCEIEDVKLAMITFSSTDEETSKKRLFWMGTIFYTYYSETRVGLEEVDNNDDASFFMRTVIFVAEGISFSKTK